MKKIYLLIACISLYACTYDEEGDTEITAQKVSEETESALENTSSKTDGTTFKTFPNPDCDCTDGVVLKYNSYFDYEFNCHQYVRAYFYGSRYGIWIPSQYDNPFSDYDPADYDTSKFYLDDAFVEVTDPDDAHAVYWGNDHSAVIVDQGCLVSKAGPSSDLWKHGLIHAGGGSGTPKYYKYVNRSSTYGVDENCQEQPPDSPTCVSSSTISGNYVNGGISRSLYTYNAVASGYVNVSINATGASSFQWTRTGGTASYYVSNNGANCNFSLYGGSSISFNIKALNPCDEIIATKNVIFQCCSGSGNPW